jgi:hypothetical protein
MVFGFPDTPVGQGTQAELIAEYGLDGESVAGSIAKILARGTGKSGTAP